MVPGIFLFFGGIGTGIRKIWYRKKVPVSVSEKFGTGKKYRNWYWKKNKKVKVKKQNFYFEYNENEELVGGDVCFTFTFLADFSIPHI